MTRKIIAATVITLGMATAALAQTSTQGGGSPAYPEAWKGDIASALYADQHTLRTQDEVKTNWAKLNADQQAQVKKDCSATAQAAATKSGESSATANANPATMTELCGWIGAM